ncbi:fatty acyl-CoA hydrolase precursor, medium chain-like [Clavelina lepadiformis]|uniref:fatty acyl-CoA hydrolase precursor, medium chain-like n=1 Tax=Clavelina lepadiformis TaxID=159417 RepID=UPI0040435E2E
MSVTRSLAALLCFSFFVRIRSQVETSNTVHTSIGTIVGTQVVTGISESRIIGHNRYLGIPFAEPPINELRFVAPKPLQQNSNATIIADQYGPACLQDRAQFDALRTNALDVNTATTDDANVINIGINEDCLYLNIYTPLNSSSSKKFPVMTFLHGGDFVSGTGAFYSGSKLAQLHQAVVVTLNYRLGAFGFLYDGDGNMDENIGLLDQKMALNWIRDNIEAFGGDETFITLFGEGSGGSSTHIHTLNTEKKLFQNAIIQSARYDDGVKFPEHCLTQTNDFLSLIKFNETGNSTQDLTVLQNIAAELILASSITIGYWGPCVADGVILDSPSNLLRAGNFSKDVNVLAGSNSASGSNVNIDVSSDVWLDMVTEQILTAAFSQIGYVINPDVIAGMGQVYWHYYNAYGQEASLLDTGSLSSLALKNRFTQVVYGDQVYRTWAQEIVNSTNTMCERCKVYEYLFTMPPSTAIDLSVQGAPLSTELTYLFGFAPTTEEVLSQQMMTYWTNFAKTGSPNAPNGAQTLWPFYQSTNETSDECRQVIVLNSGDVTDVVRDDVRSRSLDFWKIYYDLLGFTCLESADVGDGIENGTEPADDVPFECEPTVGDLFGITLSNEATAIMMFSFAATTGLFLVTTIIGCFCYSKTKKKLKKEKKKKNKESSCHDNPYHSSEARL